ncbi:MAG: Flp1 family type IVb pilin [Eubacteriales bacterium]|nr:Flp1 family type IVb pilin [Eubacteriales bacterium]
MKDFMNDFMNDEKGIGVIEVVLILVVLIGLVTIFKNKINTLLNNIFGKIMSLSEEVY